MKKRIVKRIVLPICALCILAAFGFGVAATRNQENPVFRWGQLESKHMEEAAYLQDDTPAIVAEHFTIYSDELDFLTAKQELIDPETAKSVATDILVEKYSLYYQAQLAGVVVADEHISSVIEENIRTFSEVHSDDYDAFLDGIGMTNEEYWHSRADALKITESIEAWQDMQYRAFVEANAETLSPEELAVEWTEYYSNLKANIIAQENAHTCGAEIASN